MAPGDRAVAEDLSPEERVAEQLVRRFGLSPPVNLKELAEQFADVEEDAIPGECDGLVLGLHGPRPRPLILLRAGRHELRSRFTLAHELGHVMLPWHVGDNLACQTDRLFLLGDAYAAAAAESQANRFAAELLVPSAWLGEQIARLGTDQVAPLLEAISEARVSSHVACLRLVDTLPQGHAFAIVDSSGLVIMSGQTAGTGIYPPRRGEALERKRLDRFAVLAEEVRYASRRVIWWTFTGRAATDEVDSDPRDSQELLSAVLDRHSRDDDDRRRIQRMLSGVIGAANSTAQFENVTDAESLHVRFRSRFAKTRDLPEAMLDDPEFELWLLKRAVELGR